MQHRLPLAAPSRPPASYAQVSYALYMYMTTLSTMAQRWSRKCDFDRVQSPKTVAWRPHPIFSGSTTSPGNRHQIAGHVPLYWNCQAIRSVSQAGAARRDRC